ncbi:SWIM zinc finger family protein [Nocardioides panaciterrulae]|uniref:Putative Zn finger protein n=1 Tax=Nocardioides panaciterrulae TaxID=661492 RepID=A0A7Y9EA33_9ACTN|nr:SWIM zinc finger family protein [Nocardioides panaciterrulae]NYD43878.1 putative Zn finger protein [Nocardioides panaciterrulae]
MTTVVHPAGPGWRRGGRPATWWGRAWGRAVEEAAYDEQALAAGRSLARAGAVGAVTTEAGRFAADVADGSETCRVTGTLPVLDPTGRESLVEAVAAGGGRLAALLAGDLPHDLVEHAEEAGVELLPYGGELVTGCTCRGWTDPCRHALALLTRLTWLVEADPLVLLHLRGLSREELLSRLHAGGPAGDADEDLDVALDAALRAAAVLRVLDDDHARIEHLL